MLKHMLRANEKTALLKLKDVVLSRFNLVDFRIYGSKVRATDTSESDVDVMIEIDEYSTEAESLIDNVVYDLNLEYDCFISVVLFSQEEIEHGPLAESPLYKVIVREGIRM